MMPRCVIGQKVSVAYMDYSNAKTGDTCGSRFNFRAALSFVSENWYNARVFFLGSVPMNESEVKKWQHQA